MKVKEVETSWNIGIINTIGLLSGSNWIKVNSNCQYTELLCTNYNVRLWLNVSKWYHNEKDNFVSRYFEVAVKGRFYQRWKSRYYFPSFSPWHGIHNSACFITRSIKHGIQDGQISVTINKHKAFCLKTRYRLRSRLWKEAKFPTKCVYPVSKTHSFRSTHISLNNISLLWKIMMLLLSSWFYLLVFISPVIITARPVTDEQDELFASADITTNAYPVEEATEQPDITTNDQPNIIATSYQYEQPIKQPDTSPVVPQTNAYPDNFIAGSFSSQQLPSETGSGQSSDTSWLTGSDNKAGGQNCNLQQDGQEYIRCLYGIKELNFPNIDCTYAFLSINNPPRHLFWTFYCGQKICVNSWLTWNRFSWQFVSGESFNHIYSFWLRLTFKSAQRLEQSVKLFLTKLHQRLKKDGRLQRGNEILGTRGKEKRPCRRQDRP